MGQASSEGIDAMKVIVLRGVPGTGKTALAETIGQRLAIPVFALDWVLGVLRPFDVLTRDNSAAIGYGMIEMLAERQLRLGQSAILDTPAHTVEVVEGWQACAARYQATLYVVETVCSDVALHRQRVEGRRRSIPGWHEITWEHVERMRERLEPWSGKHLRVDAVEPLADNIAAVLAYIGEASVS